MKTPEEIMKEMHWTYDADPGRYSLFISLIKPAMENYAEQFKILNKHEVSKRKGLRGRNLLLAFAGWLYKVDGVSEVPIYTQIVDDYLSEQ